MQREGSNKSSATDHQLHSFTAAKRPQHLDQRLHSLMNATLN